MKSLILDIITFFKTLTFVDYVLYLAMLVLIILVVSLIYLLRTTDIDSLVIEDDDDFDIKKAVEEIELSANKEI